MEDRGDQDHREDWYGDGALLWNWDEEGDSVPTSDTPEKRSGHIAVVDGHCMYVWGGYKESTPG